MDFQSWACAVALVENGAQIHLPNRFGITPFNLSPDLAKEQKRIISESFQALSKDNSCVTPQDSVKIAPEHSKFVARWFRKTKLRHKQNRAASQQIERDPESTTYSAIERDRASSVSSNKSRFSVSLRFSITPPPSQIEDLEMESRSPDLDFKVGSKFALCIVKQNYL